MATAINGLSATGKQAIELLQIGCNSSSAITIPHRMAMLRAPALQLERCVIR